MSEKMSFNFCIFSYLYFSQFLKLVHIVNETNPDDTSLKNASSITYSTESIHIPTFGRFPENNTLLKAEVRF